MTNHIESLLNLDTELSGFLASDLISAAVLKQSPGHTVYRLTTTQGSYILKWFDAEGPVEIKTYALLEQHRIPTLPVYVRSARALLIEDLASSPGWRLAAEADVKKKQTGTAIAAWYRKLHAAGYKLLKRPENRPGFLNAWVDEIDSASLSEAGRSLELDRHASWDFILANVEPLQSAYRAQPQTFNYNDFYWGNLALSRLEIPLQAVIFDYDYFKIGTAYSDWRNVCYSLGGEGRAAFQEAYGPVSELERALDEPLSALYGLILACKRETFPAWAEPLLVEISSGQLERSVHKALEVAG